MNKGHDWGYAFSKKNKRSINDTYETQEKLL